MDFESGPDAREEGESITDELVSALRDEAQVKLTDTQALRMLMAAMTHMSKVILDNFGDIEIIPADTDWSTVADVAAEYIVEKA